MSNIKYVAFDVHKATISAAALNLEGKLLTQTLMQTDATAIRDFLRGISGSVHLTFEEGTLSQWLFELARPLVTELLVCNTKHASSIGNKSDRVDALRLAQYLRAGLLKPVYHGSAATHTLKHLAHIYDSISADATRAMNRLKSLSRASIIRLPIMNSIRVFIFVTPSSRTPQSYRFHFDFEYIIVLKVSSLLLGLPVSL